MPYLLDKTLFIYKINQSVYVILSGSQWRSEESKTVQHKKHCTHKTIVISFDRKAPHDFAHGGGWSGVCKKFIYLFRKCNRPKHDTSQQDCKLFQSVFLFDYFRNDYKQLYLHAKNPQHFVECSCFLFLILLTFFQYPLFSLYILYQYGNNIVKMYQIGTNFSEAKT